MRPPVLLLLAIGEGAPIPLPLFLLWPFAGLFWLLFLLAQLLTPTGGSFECRLATANRALALLGTLPGLRVRLEPKDGVGVDLWII